MASLLNNLGGSAGFGENFLERNDDFSTRFIDLTSVFGTTGLNFFGNFYSGLFVNNNGSVTFEFEQFEYTPEIISAQTDNPIIAPYWADVDTSGGPVQPTRGGTSQGTNLVWYDLDPVNRAFTVTWDDVGYFSFLPSSIFGTDRVNAFQLQLRQVGSAGDFDIEFRYESIDWTTGEASGGLGGLSDGPDAIPARAGYSAGNGEDVLELPQSGNETALLALETASNVGIAGVYRFFVRNGTVVNGGFPEELFLRQAGGGLVAWDSTLGSTGFRYLLNTGPTTTVADVADFTGDGFADVVFRQSSGTLVGWNIAQGSAGFFTLPALGGFSPIKTGDFVGGRGQDLLLQAPSGALRILEVATGAVTDLLTLGPGFVVSGIGNIDEYGRDDIIFQNSNTGAVFALTDDGFSDLLTLNSGWTVVGLGNVTGSAADDFIFRNANTGVTIFWDVGQGGGGFRDFATVGNEWSFGAFADLNGDGRDDVLLQNVNNGAAIYWSGTGWVDLGNVLSQVQLVGVSDLG